MSGGPLVQSSPDAMIAKPLQRKVTINIPMGFHMRPVGAFAKLASTFGSTITVIKDDRRVNGKSALDLMLLAAEHGTELTLEADGPDAQQALDALADLLANWKGDPEEESPSPPKG
jgi:phosphotransferase system HPr (HPr) family protein